MRACQGDVSALDQIFLEYEPHIRRAVKRRLRDYQRRVVRSTMDSDDFVQSVWVTLLEGFQNGSFHAESRAEFLALLRQIAVRRIERCMAYLLADRRDVRRISSSDVVEQISCAQEWNTDDLAELRDSIEMIRERLTSQEWDVARRYMDGESWNEIGTRIGATSHATRMKFFRALGRVRDELNPPPPPQTTMTAENNGVSNVEIRRCEKLQEL